MVIQVYAPTSNAEEAEVEWFYEDLQDLLELTPKKDVLFIIRDWNAKVGSQETPGVTGKFGLGIWNKSGKRLIEFCQENALVIANTLFQHTREDCVCLLFECVNIQKTKSMASGPITSWQIEGGKVEKVTDFLFFGSKITVDSNCRHEIKRRLLLGRKVDITRWSTPK